MLTLVLFYFTQGFPIGLFYYALPAWMAAHGVGTAAIASVVATAALPWSLKLINGFLVDRYTFLPMGRRRVWIIGAQSALVASLALGGLLAPQPHDVALIAALAFAANAAVTFQDVGIDSLAIDIMPEEERARASGIMTGAQYVGVAVTAAAGGWLLAHWGSTLCFLFLAVLPGVVMLYAVVIREREGERRLPWSSGASHPANRAVQIDAWWPLLVRAARAVVAPTSLLLLPVLVVRGIPDGAAEAFQPTLFQQELGWSVTQYTGFISFLILAGGLQAMIIGGWLVERIGAQRSLAIAMGLGVAAHIVMGAARPLWDEPWFLIGYVVAAGNAAMFFMIAFLTVTMRVCNPSVAATQFTISMAISNFGRPLGAGLAAATAGAGHPQAMYFALAAAWGLVLLLVMKVTYPAENRAQHALAEVLPHGEGVAPEFD